MAWLDSLDTTTPSRSLQIGCAMSYALSSIGIMFINKIVLTSYGFPSFQFLAVCQFIATIVCLQILKMCNVLSFPSASLSTIRALMPLPIIFLLNCVSGLGGTKHLSLPMFTVLRRFSIVMILFMEAYILHKPASQRTKLSVFLLIAGSLVAAWADVGFNLTGYSLVLFNDFTTALYGVYMKKKLESKELGTFGLLFYNSAVSILPATAIMMVVQPDAIGKSLDFPLWNDPLFASLFLCATLLGCALNIATVLCTKTTSALTTAMVGSLKNTLTTYVGMFAGGDYIFNPTNFAGLTISVSGSLYYTFVKYDEMKTANKQLPTPATASEK